MQRRGPHFLRLGGISGFRSRLRASCGFSRTTSRSSFGPRLRGLFRALGMITRMFSVHTRKLDDGRRVSAAIKRVDGNRLNIASQLITRRTLTRRTRKSSRMHRLKANDGTPAVSPHVVRRARNRGVARAYAGVLRQGLQTSAPELVARIRTKAEVLMGWQAFQQLRSPDHKLTFESS